MSQQEKKKIVQVALKKECRSTPGAGRRGAPGNGALAVQRAGRSSRVPVSPLLQASDNRALPHHET